MLAWFNDLLVSTNSFMPHGACYLWLPSILWLHVISDTIIVLAYYSIPFALLYFVYKRTDLVYRWVFVLFGVFILLCGTTHLMSIWTIWHPDYWLDGLIKFATALVSIVTALLIWPLIPKLLQLPSPQALKTSETFIRAIFNATPDAMLISNEQGIITMVNQQAERLLGYKANELIGQSIEMLVPERFRAGHPALRVQFAASPYTRTMGMGRVVMALKKDNSEFDVDISLSPIQTEQGLFFASALRDVTLRKQAESALQASEERFRRMANNSPIMIWITDENGEPSFVNQSWLDFAGINSAQITHEEWIKMVHPDDRDTAFVGYYHNTQCKDPITTEYRLRGADGDWHWILDKGMPIYDEVGVFTGYIGSAIDITERKQAEVALQQLKVMIDTSLDGFWIVDRAGNVLRANEAYAKMSGYSIDELVGMHISQLDATEDSEQVKAHITKVIAQGFDVFETHHRHKDGYILDVEVSATFLPEFQQFCVFCRDITERKQAEAHLRVAATAFESQESMVITDADSVILQVNRAFTESTGYTAEEAVGQKINLLKSGRHDEAFYTAMWESIERTGSWQGEIWDRRKNGEIYPKWLTITAVKGGNGEVTHYVGTHNDITERKATEEEIKHLAFYDTLTQLPNRRLLMERLRHGIEIERREGKQLALLMLDLDRFKAVNDSLGHLAGDALLQQVAARITSRLRDVDMVARLGGDEFIVLLEDISHPQDAARVAKEIITDLNKPFQLIQSDDVRIGASIGISLYPQHGDSLEILMDHADAALYQAKDQGRGCFAYFSEDLTIAVRERIELESRLRRAIQQQELRVFYQPQMDIASGRIVGAEALVRWQDPIEGLIPPFRFIPIAEETSLIVEIGEWVLRETCRQGRQWLADGLPPLTLAVNVSPHQFRRSDINALVAAVLAETGFPAGQLELEITESGLMDNQDNATAILNSLRAQGIRLAIDDFGTGYSLLSYLKHFPLDVLKIDKSFIDEIPHNKDDIEIAATIIAMAHTLGFKVSAEGVETPEQLAFLRENGCDTYQGFIKSRPIPAEELVGLLRDQQKSE